jgi:hypothetical protein
MDVIRSWFDRLTTNGKANEGQPRTEESKEYGVGSFEFG